MRPDASRSLSLIVSLWIVLTIAAGMAIYAFFEYAYVPGVTVAEIVLEHVWHVLVLGLVIYALCLVLLRRVVVRPLELLRLHLRRVSSGELDELVVATSVTEVRHIVDGINGMIHRMKAARQRASEDEEHRSNAVDQLVERARRQLLEIEGLSEQLEVEQRCMAVSIRQVLPELGKVLAEMPEGSLNPSVAAIRKRTAASPSANSLSLQQARGAS